MSESAAPSAGTERFSRRYFFEMVGSGAIAVTILGSGVFTWEFLSPNVLFEPPTAFRAGRPSDYVPGSVTFHGSQKTYVVRQADGTFYAMSAVCTHLGCITAWKSESRTVACPCHGSIFSLHGEVLSGPAPAALPHFLIAMNDRGEMVVDRAAVVDPARVLKV